MMQEVWKAFDNYYQVSTLGRVRRNGKILKPSLVSGYHRITLHRAGVAKGMTVHRLVALTFIPNPENKPTVNHKDGNRTNNRLSNLEWNTYQENLQHSFRVLGRTAPQYLKPPQTHCKNGHEYTEVNTYRAPKTGGRSCLPCMYARHRRVTQARRATGRTQVRHRKEKNMILINQGYAALNTEGGSK